MIIASANVKPMIYPMRFTVHCRSAADALYLFINRPGSQVANAGVNPLTSKTAIMAGVRSMKVSTTSSKAVITSL